VDLEWQGYRRVEFLNKRGQEENFAKPLHAGEKAPSSEESAQKGGRYSFQARAGREGGRQKKRADLKTPLFELGGSIPL